MNGTGLSARKRSCALAASMGTMSRAASDVATMAASCELCLAVSIRRAAAAILRSHPGAAGQPLSSTMSKGPVCVQRPAGSNGSRHRENEAGRDAQTQKQQPPGRVRRGLIPWRSPRMSRSGGNGTSAGRGGVMRSRKYKSGKPASAARTKGKVKASGIPDISGRPLVLHAD